MPTKKTSQNITPFQQRLILFWVKLRTSFWYLYGFVGFCLVWVIFNKVPGFPHWDNSDLTYLNLLLSILAEVSSITILVYTLRISERAHSGDESLKSDMASIKESLRKAEIRDKNKNIRSKLLIPPTKPKR